MAEGAGGGGLTLGNGGGVSVANGNCLSNGGDFSVVEDDEEGEYADLEPFFFDEAEAVADHERQMRREQEAARKQEQRVLAAKMNKAVIDAITDYDPKQGGMYYNRFSLANFSYFNIDEESPLEPMRYSDKIYNEGDQHWPFFAVDFLSVKIISLDIDFPIHVYGTVIARDSLDSKCVYLFQRDKEHSQLINSKDESLFLTGPKRGLVLVADAYIETDLKTKDHHGQEVKELSKGLCSVRGIASRDLDKCKIESELLATRLSTVEVEATLAIDVLQGEFYGKITARTSSIPSSILLHDSKVVGVMTCDGKRVVQLSRRVVAVCLKDKLEVTAVAQTGDVECEGTIALTPALSGRVEGELAVGSTKMVVMVTWSVLD
ncbi:hypothetical protein EJB05_09585 [Eragrostis curvula]|uniref:DUF6598 domain-containing protein n=1 Tax=Eragrostis curvula TaxID=38414 RepID=A0A5J9W5D4_9POAL|nr:hypothetical protein EJB05_09585 [Eragrostis curvula]